MAKETVKAKPFSRKAKLLSSAKSAEETAGNENRSATERLETLFSPPKNEAPEADLADEIDATLLGEAPVDSEESMPVIEPFDDPVATVDVAQEPATDTSKPAAGRLKGMISGGKSDDEELALDRHSRQTRMDAEQARKIMNLLGTMGPVFKRVVGNSDSDDSARLVSELLIKAESLKQRLYSVFHAEQEAEVPKWLKAQLSRYAVNMVTDETSMSLDDMVAMSKDLSEFMPDLRYEYSNRVDDKTQLKLTMIRSVSKIQVEIDAFTQNLKEADEKELAKQIERNKANIIDEVTDFIVNKVSDAMTLLSDPKSTGRTRTMMAQSLINQASEFYLSSLVYELSNFWEKRSSKVKAGQQKQFIEQFSERHEDGLPLEATSRRAEESFDILSSAVENEFSKQFDRLINFTYSKSVNSSERLSSSEIN